MAIEVLQADNSIEYQRQLVAETLPELESFIIIGKRPSASGKMANFASCSFRPDELAFAIANFLMAHREAAIPFISGCEMFLKAPKSQS